MKKDIWLKLNHMSFFVRKFEKSKFHLFVFIDILLLGISIFYGLTKKYT